MQTRSKDYAPVALVLCGKSDMCKNLVTRKEFSTYEVLPVARLIQTRAPEGNCRVSKAAQEALYGTVCHPFTGAAPKEKPEP